MPKPVLSDSLYNADDVASAIVNNVELGVINTDLAVANRESEFTLDAYWTGDLYKNIFSFNGFMFFNFYIHKTGETPPHGQVIYTISSGFRPSTIYSVSTSGHQGDSAEHIKFNTSGIIEVQNPFNMGTDNYYLSVMGWYRFA